MKLPRFLTYIVLPVLLSAAALAQSNVNESLETATVWVDGARGSDSNPGTQANPLKSIGAALNIATANNHASIGTRVIVKPGTYREAVSLSKNSRTTSLPITVQAATNGTVVLSGADIWTGWIQYSGNPEVFTHNWPFRYGVCAKTPSPSPIEQDVVFRQEMVIVDGVPLTQVFSLPALQPGTFFANEANSEIYIRPAAGTNIQNATVEVAVQPALFSITNVGNIVLRGLTFQYSNACHQHGAVQVYNGNNILIDTDSFNWNNAIGLEFQSSQNFTVQNSVANHNGQTGFHTNRVKSNLWQSDQGSFNNWRGAQGAFYGWDTGGAKFMLNHGGTFKNLVTTYNQTHGIHFDTDNENISVDSAIVTNNVESLLVEKSQGPTSISNSYLCGSALIGLQTEGGLVIRDSPSLTLNANQIRENLLNQIVITGVHGGIPVTNWETGVTTNLFTEKLTATGNTIQSVSNTQVFKDSYLGSTDWTLFTTTLNSDNNHWYAGSSSSYTVPLTGKQHILTFLGWQGVTGQDLQSTWVSTSAPTQCNQSADSPDFWLLSGNTAGATVNSARQALFSLMTMALGGKTGTVNLTTDGISSIPGGVHASFTSSAISMNGSSVLTLTTSSTTPAGNYPFTVIANSGDVTRTVTLELIVP
jgi:hypothetical protein